MENKGIIVFIYLDDILLLGNTQFSVEKNLKILLQDLQLSGMTVNLDKSICQATQVVNHMGFQINPKEGFVGVPPEKLKTVRRELGKLVTHKVLTCRKMAAILGVVRYFLTAMPFLRAFTDNMMEFVRKNFK